MDYAGARARAVLDSYGAYINTFLSSYKKGRPTVVMLPGGMGSQLDRSRTPFTGDAIPFTDFTPSWLSPKVITNADALHLQMTPEGADNDNYIIVPDGPLRFLVNAYDGTEKFFDDNGINYIVFGYDWRRPLEEAAVNLRSFLNLLKTAVYNHTDEHIGDNLTLLCHSQGGLVAKIFINNILGKIDGWFKYFITVATPFYGTATHMQRFFKGEPLLNWIYGPAVVAKIVGTLPGPYNLMPIGIDVWQRRRGVLTPGFPYPMVDEHGQPIDPYDGNNVVAGNRYPAWVSRDYIDRSNEIRAAIDADTDPTAVPRFFHMRAGSTLTDWQFRWNPINAAFDPNTSDQPIVATTLPANARGDGTVPFWSARLAQVPDAQVYEIATQQTHQDLIENTRTLSAIWYVMQNGSLPLNRFDTLPDESYGDLPRRTRPEVDQFMQDAAAGRVPANDPRWADKPLWRAVIREMQK